MIVLMNRMKTVDQKVIIVNALYVAADFLCPGGGILKLVTGLPGHDGFIVFVFNNG